MTVAIETVIDAVNRVWRSANIRRDDPMWHAALGGLSSEQLQHGIRTIARSQERWVPKPGDVRQWCYSMPPRTFSAPPQPRDTSPRALAWRTSQITLCRLLCGRMPASSASAYDGGFDCEIIAEAVMTTVDIPARDAMPIEEMRLYDTALFGRLRELFDIEWEKFDALEGHAG